MVFYLQRKDFLDENEEKILKILMKFSLLAGDNFFFVSINIMSSPSKTESNGEPAGNRDRSSFPLTDGSLLSPRSIHIY